MIELEATTARCAICGSGDLETLGTPIPHPDLGSILPSFCHEHEYCAREDSFEMVMLRSYGWTEKMGLILPVEL